MKFTHILIPYFVSTSLSTLIIYVQGILPIKLVEANVIIRPTIFRTTYRGGSSALAVPMNDMMAVA